MNNKELTEFEIRNIVNNIEEDYAHLSNEDWYKIVQILEKRANV